MKILNIKDTRDYEEGPNDRWIAIAGSGILNQCERCNKDHEVHVTVQDGDKVFMVGTGCATKEDMITSKQAKAGNSTAKTIAKWQAQIESLEAPATEWNRIENEERQSWLDSNKIAGNRFAIDKNTRNRMGIPLNEFDDNLQLIKSYPNPSYLLHKAQRSLARAEKKMVAIIA